MKLINLFTILAFFMCTIFVSSAPVKEVTEISFPKKVNGEKGGIITASTSVKDEDGYVLEDYALKNCRYNISDKRVYCNFTERDTKKYYTVIFKTNVKKNCTITPETTFKYVNTLDASGDYNQYVLEYTRDKNLVVNGINLGINNFTFKTNDNCKYVLKVKGAIMRTNGVPSN